MRVAIINETSARAKNDDLINALRKVGVEPVNVGMTSGDNEVELTYIHTGLMAGIILNLGAVDMAVGGCGTGQGFLLSSMQYPSVFCGLIVDPLDAWLFNQINGGNCVSLALNKGYGWAGDINLEYIFSKLFDGKPGNGYPPHRQESQRASRAKLMNLSKKTHKPILEILDELDNDIIETVFSHKPFVDVVCGKVKNKELQKEIVNKYIK